ncbi:MAG: sugar kinase, partial [Actinomycetia bacterium]|nr:sugar kinase [Actinomycetes bacterium]
MSPIITLRPAEACAYDLVCLGEVMLRLDPREHRIRTARSFDVWDSGAEYNVAKAMRGTFGLRAAIVTAFADNEVGRLLENIIAASQLDLSFVRWVPFDGIGARARNGLNFTERGFGVRGGVGCADRANTAISQLRPDDVDLDTLFVRRGTRWFHTGGIMAGLSEQAAQTAEAFMRAAKASGACVSYDLNYRPSLWKARGGLDECREVNRRLAGLADVVFGNEEDYSACLGYETNADASYTHLDAGAYEAMVTRLTSDFANLRVVAVSLRQVRSASRNDWGGLAWCARDGFVRSTWREGLEVFDRIGGGDSFASGIIYGLMAFDDLSRAVEYGAANGAWVMT